MKFKLEDLTKILDRRSYRPGKVIFRESQTASTAFIVLEGQVRTYDWRRGRYEIFDLGCPWPNVRRTGVDNWQRPYGHRQHHGRMRGTGSARRKRRIKAEEGRSILAVLD
jgi:CRP-like cAMP-binding protein